MTEAGVGRPRIQYSVVLSTVWQIFTRHKVIWLLGMLAALFGRNSFGGSVSFSMRYPSASLLGPLPDLSNTLLRGFNDNPWPYLIGGGIVVVLVWLVVSLLGSLVSGTLIAYVGEAIHTSPPDLNAAWTRGRQRVWALWAATLLLTVVPLLALGGLVACALGSILAPLAGMTNANAQSDVIGEVLVNLGLFLIPAICVGVPAAILFSVLVSVTAPAVVLGNRNALAAIGQAFKLLFRYLGWILLTWLLLVAIGIGVGALVMMPTTALWLAVSRASILGEWSVQDSLLLAATLGYTVVVGIGLGGILTGFSTTLWTVLYDAMAVPEAGKPQAAAAN